MKPIKLYYRHVDDDFDDVYLGLRKTIGEALNEIEIDEEYEHWLELDAPSYIMNLAVSEFQKGK